MRCCHGQLAPVSSGHLLTFDVTGNKAREIASDHIVTIGNEESCPGQHRNLTGVSPKPRHEISIAPYSTDDRAITIENNVIRESERIRKMATSMRIFLDFSQL